MTWNTCVTSQLWNTGRGGVENCNTNLDSQKRRRAGITRSPPFYCTQLSVATRLPRGFSFILEIELRIIAVYRIALSSVSVVPLSRYFRRQLAVAESERQRQGECDRTEQAKHVFASNTIRTMGSPWLSFCRDPLTL